VTRNGHRTRWLDQPENFVVVKSHGFAVYIAIDAAIR
jgi:hypothetical protein